MPKIGRPPLHKATHQDGGTDELDITGLTRSPVFVDRGDPAAWDFTAASFTMDGAWHDLNLSPIVTVGAKAVLIRIQLSDAAANSQFKTRKKGNANTINMNIVFNQVTTLHVQHDIIVILDANLLIEYQASVSFDTINAVIGGWWI